MSKLGLALAICIGTGLISSCGKESALKSQDLTQVTHKTLQSSIFTPKCMRCHNSAVASGNLDFTNYNSLMASKGMTTTPVVTGSAEGSGIYQRIKSGSMPPGAPLSAEEIESVAAWVKAGAPQ